MQTHDLADLAVMDMPAAFVQRVVCCNMRKKRNAPQLPHIRAIQVERREESLILDAASRT